MTGLVVAFAESSKSKNARIWHVALGQPQRARQLHRHSASHVRNPHGGSRRLLRGYCWSTKGYLARFEIRYVG